MKEVIVSYRRTTLESLEYALDLLIKEERKPGMKVYPSDNSRAISDLKWLHREISKGEELEE